MTALHILEEKENLCQVRLEPSSVNLNDDLDILNELWKIDNSRA
jgi:hypothetical protein